MAMVPSDADRAKVLHGRIVKAASELYAALDAFCRMKGWQFFGCKSFSEYAAKHLNLSRQSAYQHLAKANALGKIAGALGLPAATLDGEAAIVPWREASAMANQPPEVFAAAAHEARLAAHGLDPDPAALAAATATRVRQKAAANGNPSPRAHTRRPTTPARPLAAICRDVLTLCDELSDPRFDDATHTLAHQLRALMSCHTQD